MSTPIINAVINKYSSNTQQYKQIVLLGSRDFQSQVVYPNAKYIIRYNFNLGGQEIEIPENCIIAIDGGSISNGTLVGNNTIFLNVNNATNILDNVTLSGTWGSNSSFEPDTNNLSLVYFDKTNNKLLWWNGEEFVEYQAF